VTTEAVCASAMLTPTNVAERGGIEDPIEKKEETILTRWGENVGASDKTEHPGNWSHMVGGRNELAMSKIAAGASRRNERRGEGKKGRSSKEDGKSNHRGIEPEGSSEWVDSCDEKGTGWRRAEAWPRI